MAAQYVASVFDLKDEQDLGEKVNQLLKLNFAGFSIPPTFVIKPQAYTEFLDFNKLGKKISHLLGTVDFEKAKSVQDTALYIKKHMSESEIPEKVLKEIISEFRKINGILHHREFDIFLSNHLMHFPTHSVRGDSSLVEAVKSMWINLYPILPASNPTLIVQRKVIGKTGKIKTSTKLIKSSDDLSLKDKINLETLVDKFKKEFYFPHEIDWVINLSGIHILKIKPETNVDATNTNFAETDYVITRNSHLYT